MTVVSLHLSTGGCAGYLIGSPLLAFVLSFLMSFCCSFAPSSFVFDNFSSSPPAVLLLAIPSAAKQPRRSRLVSPPDAHRSVKYRCPFCGVFHVRMPVAQFSLCPHASCLECIRGSWSCLLCRFAWSFLMWSIVHWLAAEPVSR